MPYGQKKGEGIIAIDINALRAKEKQNLNTFVYHTGKGKSKI